MKGKQLILGIISTEENVDGQVTITPLTNIDYSYSNHCSMKLKSLLISTVSALLLCFACNPANWASTNWFIELQNDSTEKIWVTTGCKYENGKIYLTTDFPMEGDRDTVSILPQQKGWYTKMPYRDVVHDANAMLAIFIISDEVYNSYSWEEIGEKEMFLKKYVFRYGDMRAKYPITYPKDYD